MKVLMLTPYLPYPPITGGRIRMWEQVRYLGQRHHLTVVCFYLSEEELAFQDKLLNYCVQIKMVKYVEPSPLKRPLGLSRLVYQWATEEMRKTLKVVSSVNFDVVLIEHIFMAQYYSLLDNACIILQEHNIESNIRRRFAKLYHNPKEEMDEQNTLAARAFEDADQEWNLLAEYENRIWPKFPLRITVSEKDKQHMDNRCPVGRSIVIENGVNPQSITLVTNSFASRKVLFMGTMTYYPNIDAVFYSRDHVLPEIWKKDRTVSLCVAGRDPSQVVQELTTDPRIEVISTPENMSEAAQNCSLTVVPMRVGGGTRIKILHSMAMGLPVVSTSIGCEGLFVEDGVHLLVRDDPSEFSDAILLILSDLDLANALRKNGRNLVDVQYDWRFIFDRLEMEMLFLIDSIRQLQ